MKHRPRYGEKWAALSAIALIGFLFLDWFGTPTVDGAYFDRAVGAAANAGVFSFEGAAASGWDALGWFALGVCVLAALAGLATTLTFMLYDSPVLPLFFAIGAAVLGIAAVIALLVQVVLQPGEDEIVQVMSGWWLGLLAAAGVARGGFLSMRDEYLPGVPMPDVEVRPAPVA